MQIFTRTATAVVLATLATAAGAQGYKPVLINPMVGGSQPVLVNSGRPIVAGPVASRPAGEAFRDTARAQAAQTRSSADAARAAARSGR
jgi:hypothetical protein